MPMPRFSAAIDGVSTQRAARPIFLRNLTGHCCDASRIESATQENATGPARQTVANRLLQKLLESLDIFLWPRQPKRLFDGKIGVATDAQLSVRINQSVSSR